MERYILILQGWLNKDVPYMIKIFAVLALLSSFIDCDAQVRNELEYKLSFSNDTVYVSLNNKGLDTLYLFNSYLEMNPEYDRYGTEPLWESEYLHRFDKGLNEYKLSFLPIIPYLSVRYSDVAIHGKSRIVHRWQLLYGFKTIFPNDSIQISIPKSAFVQELYVKDVPIKQFGKNDKISFEKIQVRQPKTISLEFALYRSIDLLRSTDAYYFNEADFDEQAKSYEVMTIICDLSRFSELKEKDAAK